MPVDPGRHDELLADLNEPQRAAVTHREGPLLVIAGPGSGKTRVITRRAAYLVHAGVPSHNVLAITFTNKATDEMRRRIEALGVGQGMWVYTFHALGARLLRELGPRVRVEAGFSIYDETDSLRVVKEALAIERLSEGQLRPDDVRAWISAAKSRLLAPEAAAAGAEHFEDAQMARVYATYQQLIEQRNAVDFDDLLMKVALGLEAYPEVTERLNARFRYVLIDEYQDTNHAQYLIARLLSQHHRNICVTGDPDQSIYAWRGADLRNILEFERDYPDAQVIRLEQNYRSTGRILAAASRLIQRNMRRKRKDLWTQNDAGVPVECWAFDVDADEAERIAATIAQQRAAGRPYQDFAIFYRVNALSRGLEESLRAHGVPYRIARGVEFYNRKEIKDVVAYLRVLTNPADDVAALRIINTPPRGIGKTTVERLQTFANERRIPITAALRHAEDVPGLRAAARRVRAFADLLDRMRDAIDVGVAEAVSNVLTASGLEEDLRHERDTGGEDRLANVQELVTAAVRFEQDQPGGTLVEFLQRVSLVSDQDAVDEHAGAVLLMTLHAAKGLEFPVVFLIGLEQGLLPHERAIQAGDIEEERRLCFVGLTRARERLVLTRANDRFIRGQPMARTASQFIKECDDGTLIHVDRSSSSPPWTRRGALDDGFVPLVDDLPPEEAARFVPRRRGFDRWADADGAGEGRLRRQRQARARHSGAATPSDAAKPTFADWSVGTLVRHDEFGVGQVLWVRPASGHTRACIRFAGYGEKVLILEIAPVRRLSRSET